MDRSYRHHRIANNNIYASLKVQIREIFTSIKKIIFIKKII